MSSPPVSTDMQTGIRREGGREEGGKTHPFHRPLVHQWASQNSKTTPTISTSVVRARDGSAASACVGNVYASVSLDMSAGLQC